MPRFAFDIRGRAVVRDDGGAAFGSDQDIAHHAKQNLLAITTGRTVLRDGERRAFPVLLPDADGHTVDWATRSSVESRPVQ